MSFQTGIYSVMVNDTSLNSIVNGGIYFDVLPNNFDLKKSWIVYNFREDERIDTLSYKNIITFYTLYAKVISPNTATLLSISDELNRYLSSYTDNNFFDITFMNDNHQNGIVDDTDIFENTIEYKIIYNQ